MKKYSFRKGFTLAEVLITLAIVGIVAALTIPTLVNKIQEAHFHAKWKECYALLNNSFKMVVAENPRMVVSDVDSFFPTSDFIEAILKHLYVEDTCGISNAYDSKICDAYYRKPYWVGTYNIYSYYKTLSGSTLNAYDFYNKAALLRNGAVVYFGGLWSGLTIAVDVNGYNQGPNIVGKDFYAINMSYSENTKVMYIESLYFKPFGANGTRTEKSGYQGCSPDIGSVTDPNGSSNALYGASGAGCSYKYLYEK